MTNLNLSDGFCIAGDVIGLDEDETHEFKSHRMMCIEELPSWCMTEENFKLKRSKQPLSKTVSAFLNTGRGGIVYLGISNEGVIKGLHMTEFQMDHVRINLTDLMKRFTPEVASSQISLLFKRVIDTEHSLMSYIPESKVNEENFELKHQVHILRTPRYCWCDVDAQARMNLGIVPRRYIIEIVVHQWDGQSETIPPLYPVYQNEEGLCYVRRLASNVHMTAQEVVEMTRNQVHQYYQPYIESLSRKIEVLSKKAGVGEDDDFKDEIVEVD